MNLGDVVNFKCVEGMKFEGESLSTTCQVSKICILQLLPHIVDILYKLLRRQSKKYPRLVSQAEINETLGKTRVGIFAFLLSIVEYLPLLNFVMNIPIVVITVNQSK